MEEVLRCSNCAGPRGVGDAKCSYCGYPFVSNPKQNNLADSFYSAVATQYAISSRSFEETIKIGQMYADWKGQSIFTLANIGLFLACGIFSIIAGFLFVQMGVLRFFGFG